MLTTILFIAGLAWLSWDLRRFESEVDRLHTLSDVLEHAESSEETLALAAEYGTKNPDTGWHERHDEVAAYMHTLEERLLDAADGTEHADAARELVRGSRDLRDVQNTALAMSRDTPSPRGTQQARALLTSDAYTAARSNVRIALEGMVEAVAVDVRTARRAAEQRDRVRTVLFGLMILALAATWAVVFARLRGYVRDRDRAEAALRESERRLSTLIDNLPGVAFRSRNDEAWTTEFVSSRIGELTGHDAAAFTSGAVTFGDLIHPEDRDRVWTSVQAALRAGEPFAVEYRIRAADGAEKWVWERGEGVAGPSGDIAVLEGFLSDISELKRAEEREREQAAIRESEHRFRRLTEHAKDLVTVIDPNAVIRFQSAAAKPVLGYDPAELTGRVAYDFIHPDDLSGVRAAFERFVVAPEEVDRVEFRFRHSDGSWRVLEASGANHLADPAINGVVLNSRDVTDRKHGEEALRSAKEAAEAASRAKGDFLSRTSHELRTPLNAILGFGQLLREEVSTDEKRQSVDQILDAGRHLLGLVDEVLDLSQATAGDLPWAAQGVIPSAALQRALARTSTLAREMNIELPAALPGACDRRVLADTRRLDQVLENLLSNAVRYNRDGGRVDITCEERAGARLRIGVRDTGPGFEPADLERIFAPFDRLGEERAGTEGVGLGLPLAKALVEVMGGTIGVESTPGAGSEFWIELPLAAPAQGAVPGEQDAARGDAAGHGASSDGDRPPSVLYVEDTPANLRLVERILDRHRPNLEMTSAGDGRRGLELARERRPDLILLDLHLPELSGEEVLEALQSEERTRSTPVIVISGDAREEQKERLLRLGARAYLTKPFELTEFLQILDDALRDARA